MKSKNLKVQLINVEKLRRFRSFSVILCSFDSVQTAPFDVQKYTFGQTLRYTWAQFEHSASFFLRLIEVVHPEAAPYNKAVINTLSF